MRDPVNVHIDYQPAPPASGASGGGSRARLGRWRRRLMLAATLGGVVLLLPAALTLVTDADRPRSEDRSGGQSPTADPALRRGTATAAASLATRSVSGLPRGFPRSRAGAVEAGASFAASVLVVQRMTSADRSAYVRDAMLRPPATTDLDQAASDFRARHRLTATGRLMDGADGADGGVSTTSRFVSVCHPELGAYRVESFSARRATVDYWMPCLLGAVADGAADAAGSGIGSGSEVRTRWQMGRAELRWHAGDWRVGELTRGPFDAPVTPPDAGEPATTLRERAALLGEGWHAFADASEERPAVVRP
ncbi:hypothetical protein ACTWP5_15565 [Streptomyces sp. 4N509B]|uniref:hypothetical protein n=1 Tax=Streptomyces sp. 4N509B TaxID=3457413 RepID=UPI003FD011FB